MSNTKPRDRESDRQPAPDRRHYIERVLDLYRTVPGALRARQSTVRHLAATLFERQVPLETVQAAVLLAVARRAARSTTRRLAPIASFRYFEPIIDELLEEPLDPGYLLYIRRKIARTAPALFAATQR
ncbi:MAG TPA: hypothetical protein VIA62_21990 [Thermoanaerobaculia bacterium]|jgi:hypothetical protein|nr:hypothetical protein [Thermoanaerobaculia bacterium]